jgi:hypothetical protein
MIWDVFWVFGYRDALQLAFADRQGGGKTDDYSFTISIRALDEVRL